MINPRLLAIVKKEFIQMRRDKLTLAMMLLLPLVQLAIFGYAINTDVKHMPMAVYDMSSSEQSRRLVQYFTNSDYFEVTHRPDKYSQINELIDSGKVKVGLIILPDYSRNLKSNRSAHVQVLVDASDPIIASSALSTSTAIGNLISMEQLMKLLGHRGSFSLKDPPVVVEVRAWYNPSLVSAHYIVPGIIGVILTMTMMIITSMAIVRERETGTLEQLITTPIKSSELMIGKIIPYIVVGYVQVTIALTVGHLLFHVPVRGSILLLYLLVFIFIVCYLGQGLLISTIARSQQQAMQMAFFIFLPTILLSGFMFPREGMPKLAQYIGLIMPLTYFLQILRGIILKGIGINLLWQHVLPLLLFMFLTLFLSVQRFKKHMD